MSNMYHWINKEKARFYSITVQNNENNVVLNYRWGSCNSNRGGKKIIPAQSHDEAQAYINKMMKRRKSRGYVLIAPN
jgi:predicted DNA-binding WGR domain protein